MWNRGTLWAWTQAPPTVHTPTVSYTLHIDPTSLRKHTPNICEDTMERRAIHLQLFLQYLLISRRLHDKFVVLHGALTVDLWTCKRIFKKWKGNPTKVDCFNLNDRPFHVLPAVLLFIHHHRLGSSNKLLPQPVIKRHCKWRARKDRIITVLWNIYVHL